MEIVVATARTWLLLIATHGMLKSEKEVSFHLLAMAAKHNMAMKRKIKYKP